jgi:hypothetical protein
MAQKPKAEKSTWYTENKNQHGAASKFGQMIGDAFAAVVIDFIYEYLSSAHSEYILLEPDKGKKLVKLEMMGGTSRQMDNVITPKNSNDPVALFESKWLKDARHHNDKGAWILQLKEMRKRYPTVRGAAANLAGYWTEGVGVMFKSEAGIKMVLVATDDEVYSTLQEPLNIFLEKHDLPALVLDAAEIQQSLPRPWDLANCLMGLKETGELASIAKTWLNFLRDTAPEGTRTYGKDLIQKAIDELLSPLPEQPQVQTLEIALQIDTGNTIYQEFKDVEEAMDFIQAYFQNPQAILKKITPKTAPKQMQLDLDDEPPLEASADSPI